MLVQFVLRARLIQAQIALTALMLEASNETGKILFKSPCARKSVIRKNGFIFSYEIRLWTPPGPGRMASQFAIRYSHPDPYNYIACPCDMDAMSDENQAFAYIATEIPCRARDLGSFATFFTLPLSTV